MHFGGMSMAIFWTAARSDLLHGVSAIHRHRAVAYPAPVKRESSDATIRILTQLRTGD